PVIRLQAGRSRWRFAPSSINIGLRTRKRSAKPAIGGGANCWELTRLLSNASRMAGLLLWICRSGADRRISFLWANFDNRGSIDEAVMACGPIVGRAPP